MRDITGREKPGEPEEAQEWACGPMGWWPLLASPPGVSWGYNGGAGPGAPGHSRA